MQEEQQDPRPSDILWHCARGSTDPQASGNVRAALFMADMAACVSPSSDSDTDDKPFTLSSCIAGNKSRGETAEYSGS